MFMKLLPMQITNPLMILHAMIPSKSSKLSFDIAQHLIISLEATCDYSLDIAYNRGVLIYLENGGFFGHILCNYLWLQIVFVINLTTSVLLQWSLTKILKQSAVKIIWLNCGISWPLNNHIIFVNFLEHTHKMKMWNKNWINMFCLHSWNKRLIESYGKLWLIKNIK